MEYLSYWQLTTDVLLLGALAYLCSQFARSPRVNSQLRTVRELQSALKALVKEADTAGRTLNEQLIKRQQSLEKALIESDVAERKIQVALAEAAHAKENQSKFISQHPEVSQATRASVGKAVETITQPELQSKENEIQVQKNNPSSVKQAVNIYGEPIQANAATNQSIGKATKKFMQAYAPLKASVQKEVLSSPAVSQPVTTAAANVQGSIEDVYASAEELLRSGTGLASVANLTNLPIEEIKALSQMIIGEKAVANARKLETEFEVPPADPRLGVLGSIKRQTITL